MKADRMQQKKGRVGLLVTSVVVVGLLVGVGVLFVAAWLKSAETETAMAQAANLKDLKAHLKAAQEEFAQGPSWADREAKVVALPLSQARAQLLVEVAANPYAATVGSEPAPVAAAGAETEPVPGVDGPLSAPGAAPPR